MTSMCSSTVQGKCGVICIGFAFGTVEPARINGQNRTALESCLAPFTLCQAHTSLNLNVYFSIRNGVCLIRSMRIAQLV